MILAPWQERGEWHGFLLAEPEASGQPLEFSSVDGETIVLQLPALEVLEGVLCQLPAATLLTVGSVVPPPG
jgi:hypothetical protein